MTELAWEPTPEYVERANVTRLMRAHGIETIDELRRRSVEDVEWYWDAAVAARLRDGEVKVISPADGTWRRGKQALMKECADEAAAASPTVERIVVLSNLGVDVPMTPGRDVTWSDFVAPHTGGHVEAEDTGSEDVFMIAYTSGTTGRPKGAVHVHGGFLVKIASEVAYQTDLHAGEVFYWVTDMGWIMGPLSMVGSHALGAAMVMYEGAPDFPEPDRVWASVEQHRVNMLGISPTLIRALKTHGDEWVEKHDLSSLRILGSTGEPWNPEPYEWLRRVAARGGEGPSINISGGQGVGACFLSTHPGEGIKVGSLGAS